MNRRLFISFVFMVGLLLGNATMFIGTTMKEHSCILRKGDGYNFNGACYRVISCDKNEVSLVFVNDYSYKKINVPHEFLTKKCE